MQDWTALSSWITTTAAAIMRAQRRAASAAVTATVSIEQLRGATASRKLTLIRESGLSR